MIYTDARDSHWSEIVTHIQPADIKKPHSTQPHEPLDFHSGSSYNSQFSWSTVEKETFAIMATLERVRYMPARPYGFDQYIGHANLVFIFDPLSLVTNLGKASVRKVLRWAVNFCVIVIH